MPVLSILSKVRTIQAFFRKKLEKRYFELCILTLDFSLRYVSSFAQKGANMTNFLEPLNGFLSILNRHWFGQISRVGHLKSCLETFDFKQKIIETVKEDFGKMLDNLLSLPSWVKDPGFSFWKKFYLKLLWFLKPLSLDG